MSTEREAYNDQFAENQWAHYLIRRVNLEKTRDAQLAILKNTQIKKNPLASAVTYLKNSFATKYPEAVLELNPKKPGLTMMEMFTQMLNFVERTLPHTCLRCKNDYFPYTQDRPGSEVSCVKCDLPAHAGCIKDEAVNIAWGIVFICDICIRNQDKPASEIPETADKPPQSSGADSESSDEQRKQQKKFSKTRKSPKPNHNESIASGSESSKDNGNDSDKQQKMCSFFKQGKCRYGVSGRSGGMCKFIHRKVCTPYRLYGEAKKGCKKKEDCEFWHPPLCYKSVNDRECFNERCRYWHLKGTAREQVNRQYDNNLVETPSYETQTPFQRNRSNTQQHERPTHQQYNPHPQAYVNQPMHNHQGPPVNNYQGATMNNDFLGQMREQINKDLTEIRKQQEMFMTRISQQMQMQIQQLQRPNLANQENPQYHVQPIQQVQYHHAYPQMQTNPQVPQGM